MIVSLIGFVTILVAQRLFMITHTTADGIMHMEMSGAMKMDENSADHDKMDMPK